MNYLINNPQKELNTINLTQFYIDTTPVYHLLHCEMTGLNCENHWTIQRTSLGNCLKLDTNKAFQHELAKRAKLPSSQCTQKSCNKSQITGSVGDILASFDRVLQADE